MSIARHCHLSLCDKAVEGADLYASGLSAKGVTVAPMRTYDASMQSTVIKADIMTDNGVIHVIDKVLIPES